MLNIEETIKILETKNKEFSFDELWDLVKKNVLKTFSKEENENSIKSDYYFSMMQDQRLIMIGNNVWGLRSNYSRSEIEKIDKTLTTEVELEID